MFCSWKAEKDEKGELSCEAAVRGTVVVPHEEERKAPAIKTRTAEKNKETGAEVERVPTPLWLWAEKRGNGVKNTFPVSRGGGGVRRGKAGKREGYTTTGAITKGITRNRGGKSGSLRQKTG